MTINYNVTGAQRKALVTALAQELNTPAVYCQAPTFAYQVGEYHIDKNGTVTGPDNQALVADIHGLHSLVPVSEDYDIIVTETPSDTEEPPTFEELPLTMEEELGLGKQRRDYPGEDGPQPDDVPEQRIYKVELYDPDSPDRMEVFRSDNDIEALRDAYEFCTGDITLLELHELDEDYNVIRTVDCDNKPYLTIEVPLTGFTPEKLDNLTKMVTAKESLFKAAFGASELPIQLTENSIKFPWFWREQFTTPTECDAYATFISLLCETAKEKKRVTAKVGELPSNSKFAMRVFLISLGMVGDEYKAARKVLLSRLEGNSAWRNGRPESLGTQDDYALAEVQADAELIHEVNLAFETEAAQQ